MTGAQQGSSVEGHSVDISIGGKGDINASCHTTVDKAEGRKGSSVSLWRNMKLIACLQGTLFA